MERVPRKKKKELKKMFFRRYRINWLNCCYVVDEYNWFFHNPLNFDMNKCIVNGN